VSREEFEMRTQGVERLRHQLHSLQKRYEALRRGPLAQDLEIARAEVEVAEARLARARVEGAYCQIRAPVSGTVVKVYREAGDSVALYYPTPILRLADARDVRVRLEIDEANVPLLRPGLEAAIEVRGSAGIAGRVRVETIVPTFGPKRLFSPDTSERQDGRTLTVLCSVRDSRVTLYPGQRVTARLQLNAPAPGGTAPPPVSGADPVRLPPEGRGGDAGPRRS
jgi:multidrug efflux pump subunit AcrA (membrane-fusion protein)